MKLWIKQLYTLHYSYNLAISCIVFDIELRELLSNRIIKYNNDIPIQDYINNLNESIS